jgi:predicted MPP superfamily phosphohydrolase
LKAWPVLGIVFIEAILFFAHWFIYRTLVVFFAGYLGTSATLALRDALFMLAFSFIIAALLGFRFSNAPVRLLYVISAVWLGLLNYFFLAACLCWLVDLGLRLVAFPPHKPLIAGILFSLAILTGIYGILNARRIRIRRIPIQLPNLPESWRGRTALLFSDLHLGNINSLRFIRRIASMAASLNPDIILIPGDLFDGTPVDPDLLAVPLAELSPPFGIFYSTGNHDEFGGAAQYAAALTRAGIRVLANEKVSVDGLQILGIPYHDSTYPIRIRATLEALRPSESGQASILLSHVPNRLPIVEQAGVSLQLSGHTHGGQISPFTWFVRRVFGKFTYGLNRFGALQVYTSSGAGTWGPPMRVGTHPEIVLLQFE